MGFRNGSSYQAKQLAVEQLHRDGKIVDSFNAAVYPGVFNFARPVVKTQNLAQHTTASSIKMNTVLKVRIETDLIAVPYALQAYYGYGYHIHIGPRPYLDAIAKIALNNSSASVVSNAGKYMYLPKEYTSGYKDWI